jgi:hypothetical protein
MPGRYEVFRFVSGGRGAGAGVALPQQGAAQSYRSCISAFIEDKYDFTSQFISSKYKC